MNQPMTDRQTPHTALPSPFQGSSQQQGHINQSINHDTEHNNLSSDDITNLHSPHWMDTKQQNIKITNKTKHNETDKQMQGYETRHYVRPVYGWLDTLEGGVRRTI